MDKREQIERVIGRYLKKGWVGAGGHHSYDIRRAIKALAEQAIVIECEVEHYHQEVFNPDAVGLQTIDEPPVEAWIKVPKTRVGRYYLDGHRGTPGKAIAIIIPLEEDDSVQPRDAD